MATSLILHIIKHPAGSDHIATIMRSYPGSGFDDRLHRLEAYDAWEAFRGLTKPMPAEMISAAADADFGTTPTVHT